jgi:hypothetical protein
MDGVPCPNNPNGSVPIICQKNVPSSTSTAIEFKNVCIHYNKVPSGVAALWEHGENFNNNAKNTLGPLGCQLPIPATDCLLFIFLPFFRGEGLFVQDEIFIIVSNSKILLLIWN